MRHIVNFIFHWFIVFPHEFCHYVPALLLGLGPKWNIRERRMSAPETGDFRDFIVTGFPVSLAFIALFFAPFFDISGHPVFMGLVFLWLCGCGKDMEDIYNTIRQK